VSATLEDLGQTIERRWLELEPSDGDSMRVIDLPEMAAAGPLLLGLREDGARLLVPLAESDASAVQEDRSSAGIQLLITPLGADDNYLPFLDVVCPKRELRWLFATFIADVLLRVHRAEGNDAVALTRTCFTTWKAMFSSDGRRLSPKQLAGLFGELHVLRRLVRRAPELVETWRGPRHEPHDFRFAAGAFEVKTTLSTEDQVVHVHGLEQLAPPEDGWLHLAHLRVEMPSDQGESVPDLVADLRDLVPPEGLGALLAAARYFDGHAADYDALTFRIVEEHWYLVEAGFPRLTADSFPGEEIPVGLGGFSYSLDLAQVIALPLSETEVDELLNGAFA
jgi:hypothetical protein